MPSAAPRPSLPPSLRRDLVLDTLGNLALGLGLWGWLGLPHEGSALLGRPEVFIPLTATGVLNLLHLPARLRRLREWQRRR